MFARFFVFLQYAAAALLADISCLPARESQDAGDQGLSDIAIRASL